MCLDAVVDPSLSSNTSLTKAAANILSMSSMNAGNAQTLPHLTLSPSNSTQNASLLFQKSTPSTSWRCPGKDDRLFSFLAVRPATSASSIQFLNSTTNSNSRPLIFHQKTNNASPQTQLLTVMPAGVRVQQLTPVVRGASNQPTTIVRLMSPGTTTAGNIRSGTGQHQIIQLNTSKQQSQPFVIKGITTQASNRQQQPILLTTNAQQRSMLPPGQQQVLVLNQTSGGQQAKFTLQMTSADPVNSTEHPRQEPSTGTGLPQLDGSIDDQVENLDQSKHLYSFQPLQNGTSGKDR